MNRINWTVVSVFALVVLLIVLIGVILPGGGGYWGMGPAMMGGWGFGTFGWVGMIFMWLIPPGFLVLTVLGIVWLLRALTGGLGHSPPPAQTCPGCGKGIQADWRNCPHCGAVLSRA